LALAPALEPFGLRAARQPRRARGLGGAAPARGLGALAAGPEGEPAQGLLGAHDLGRRERRLGLPGAQLPRARGDLSLHELDAALRFPDARLGGGPLLAQRTLLHLPHAQEALEAEREALH